MAQPKNNMQTILLQKKLHKLCSAKIHWNALEKNNKSIIECLIEMEKAGVIPDLAELRPYLQRRYNIANDVIYLKFVELQPTVKPKCMIIKQILTKYFLNKNCNRVQDKYKNLLPFLSKIKVKGYIITNNNIYKKFYESLGWVFTGHKLHQQHNLDHCVNTLKYFTEIEGYKLEEFLDYLFFSKKLINKIIPDNYQGKRIIDTTETLLKSIEVPDKYAYSKATLSDLKKAYEENYMQTIELFRKLWDIKPDLDCLFIFIQNNKKNNNSYVEGHLKNLLTEVKDGIDLVAIRKFFKILEDDCDPRNVKPVNKMTEILLKILFTDGYLKLNDSEVHHIILKNFEAITDLDLLKKLIDNGLSLNLNLLRRCCNCRTANGKIIKYLIEESGYIPDKKCLLHICQRQDAKKWIEYFVEKFGLRTDTNVLYEYCRVLKKNRPHWGARDRLRTIAIIIENMDDCQANIGYYSDLEGE